MALFNNVRVRYIFINIRHIMVIEIECIAFTHCYPTDVWHNRIKRTRNEKFRPIEWAVREQRKRKGRKGKRIIRNETHARTKVARLN